MRSEINDAALETVTGGTVIVSEDYMKVGFTTLGVMKDLKNCTYRQVMNAVADWKDEAKAQGLTNAEYDVMCRDRMQANGWI